MNFISWSLGGGSSVFWELMESSMIVLGIVSVGFGSVFMEGGWDGGGGGRDGAGGGRDEGG